QLNAFRFNQLLLTIDFLRTGTRPQQCQLVALAFKIPVEFRNLLLLFEVAKAGQDIAFGYAASFMYQNFDYDAFGFGAHGAFISCENLELRWDCELPVPDGRNQNYCCRDPQIP